MPPPPPPPPVTRAKYSAAGEEYWVTVKNILGWMHVHIYSLLLIIFVCLSEGKEGPKVAIVGAGINWLEVLFQKEVQNRW